MFIEIDQAQDALHFYTEHGLEETLRKFNDTFSNINWEDVSSGLAEEKLSMPKGDWPQLEIVLNYLKQNSHSNVEKVLAYVIAKNLLSYFDSDDIDLSGSELRHLIELQVLPPNDVRSMVVHFLIDQGYEVDVSDYIAIASDVEIFTTISEDIPEILIKVDVAKDGYLALMLPIGEDCEIESINAYNTCHNEKVILTHIDNFTFLCRELTTYKISDEYLVEAISEFLETWKAVNHKK